MGDPVRSKIKFEIEQIDHLLDSFVPLLNNVKIREPDLIELSALATLLHSFYCGIENIFTTIGKYFDGHLPSSRKWHKDLLIQMSKPTERRNAVVSKDQQIILLEYLSFRHVFRNSYAFQIDWQKIHPLTDSILKTWNNLKNSIMCFLETNKFKLDK